MGAKVWCLTTRCSLESERTENAQVPEVNRGNMLSFTLVGCQWAQWRPIGRLKPQQNYKTRLGLGELVRPKLTAPPISFLLQTITDKAGNRGDWSEWPWRIELCCHTMAKLWITVNFRTQTELKWAILEPSNLCLRQEKELCVLD